MSCEFCDAEDTDFTTCETCLSGVCFGCRSRCSTCMESICPDCDVNEDGLCKSCLEKKDDENDTDDSDEK